MVTSIKRNTTGNIKLPNLGSYTSEQYKNRGDFTDFANIGNSDECTALRNWRIVVPDNKCVCVTIFGLQPEDVIAVDQIFGPKTCRDAKTTAVIFDETNCQHVICKPGFYQLRMSDDSDLPDDFVVYTRRLDHKVAMLLQNSGGI